MNSTIDAFKLKAIFDENDYRPKSSFDEVVKSSLEQEHKVFHNFDSDSSSRVKDEELSLEKGESSSYNPTNDFDESVGEFEESDEAMTTRPAKKATARQKFRRYRHKEYQCDECDRMFTLKHNLQNHFVQYHMGCKTLHKACASCKCTICGKIYSAASVLAEHMLHEHEKDLEQEECRICHEKFLTATALMKHMREHNRVWKTCSRQGCEDLKFKFVKELNEHIRLKHKAEELVCSVCNMVFRQLSAKIKHEEKHDKEDIEDEYHRRTHKAKCDEDLVKRQPQSPGPTPLKHRRMSYCPEVEAVAIKKKTSKRLTKEEILAKIK